MYNQIVKDYLRGLYDSVRIGYLLIPLYRDTALRHCFWKIVEFNLLHFISYLLIILLDYTLTTNLMPFFNLINIPFSLFSMLFHTLHYVELAILSNHHRPKISKTDGPIDLASLTITMAIYQFTIYFSTMFTDYLLPVQFYYFKMIINFITLSIYHSFYSFNNFWQYKQMKMENRIDIHERLWPYYTGYGTVSTFLYTFSYYPILLQIYNIYLAIILLLPFFIKTKYPTVTTTYPKLNMYFFSYAINCIFFIIKQLIVPNSNQSM